MAFRVLKEVQDGDIIFRLMDTDTGTEAVIYAWGALLNAFHIPVSGTVQNIVAGFHSVADARQQMHAGFSSAKLSPYVCRLRQGQYHFRNQLWQVNGFYLGEHAIHGLLYNAPFDPITAEADSEGARVVLAYHYPGSDPGYPFPYTLKVGWELKSDRRLTVTTTASQNGQEAIPFSDGWHPYFTLGGTIDDCTLQTNTNLQVEFSNDLLPTGRLLPDTRWKAGLLLKDITLDNCFVTGNTENVYAVLSNDTIQLRIGADASYPYLQLYTPPDRRRIAIENLSAAPDTFNNGMGLVMLEPGKPLSFTTSYQISLTDPPRQSY